MIKGQRGTTKLLRQVNEQFDSGSLSLQERIETLARPSLMHKRYPSRRRTVQGLPIVGPDHAGLQSQSDLVHTSPGSERSTNLEEKQAPDLRSDHDKGFWKESLQGHYTGRVGHEDMCFADSAAIWSVVNASVADYHDVEDEAMSTEVVGGAAVIDQTLRTCLAEFAGARRELC